MERTEKFVLDSDGDLNRELDDVRAKETVVVEVEQGVLEPLYAVPKDAVALYLELVRVTNNDTPNTSGGPAQLNIAQYETIDKYSGFVGEFDSDDEQDLQDLISTEPGIGSFGDVIQNREDVSVPFSVSGHTTRAFGIEGNEVDSEILVLDPDFNGFVSVTFIVDRPEDYNPNVTKRSPDVQ